MIVKKIGVVEIKNSFIVEEFNEDDGFVDISIPVGMYEYRIMDMNGWLPQQILLNGKWIDLSGHGTL